MCYAASSSLSENENSQDLKMGDWGESRISSCLGDLVQKITVQGKTDELNGSYSSSQDSALSLNALNGVTGRGIGIGIGDKMHVLAVLELNNDLTRL
jgi:hypothetical protein